MMNVDAERSVEVALALSLRAIGTDILRLRDSIPQATGI